MTDTYLQNIPLDTIVPDPDQPRNLYPSLSELIEKVQDGDSRAKIIFDKLMELGTSILEVGLQQPISVYPAKEKDRYVIFDGHRRWLAMVLLFQQGHGDGVIQCYVHSTAKTTDDTLLSQLNANTQREDLNVFELARSSQKLKEHLKENGGTVRLLREDGSFESVILYPTESDDKIWSIIEKKIGINRSRRYQIQSVLKLPSQIQRMAEEGALPESRLRYLVPLKDEQIQEIILKEILEKNLSNAEIKRRIKELQEEFAESPFAPMPKPMRIKSAIRPINKLARELNAVNNVPAAISAKDPRTVGGYKAVIPDLRSAIKDLEAILNKLEFLEPE